MLEQLCYCPVTGPVEVTVEDGEVTSAVVAKGGQGDEEGQRRPGVPLADDQRRDRRANDPEAAEVDVDWPDGQDWPNTVAVDQIENAVDDEVTYTISETDVSVG